MKNFLKIVRGFVAAAAYASLTATPASALNFDNGDYGFYSMNPAPNGSGLGNYNIILFANASGGSDNSGGSVNVDNSNTTLPTGGTSSSNTIYWLTTVADLQAFYSQQFGAPVNNIVLFLDINETGNGPNPVTISTLTVYKNPTTSLDPTGDLSSAQQNGITSDSGSILKQLSNVGPSLDQQQTGQGVDDWAIFTFIDPFALLPTDTLLFKLQMNDLSAGGEVLAISGTFSACDIDPQGCPTTGTTSTTGTTGTTGTTSTTSTTTTTTTTGSTTDPTSTTTTTTGSSSGDPTTGATTSTTTEPTTGSTSTPTTGTSSTGTDTSGITTSSSTGESSGTTSQVPEPASFLLLGAGLVWLSRLARQKRD